VRREDYGKREKETKERKEERRGEARRMGLWENHEGGK
jgi:hypothetical protein